jgi:hypothetical protein
MRYEEPADEIEEAEYGKDDHTQALLATRSYCLIAHALHLSCHQRDIQYSMPQTNKWKQSRDGQEEDLEDLGG